MRAVLQRVNYASVEVEGKVVGKIDRGLLVFLGVSQKEQEKDLKYLVDKTLNLRIFPDDAGKFNLSVLDIKGEILVVSQFTLYGDCRRGRRPGFQDAADPAIAVDFYRRYSEGLRTSGLKVETGEFQAHMKVKSENDGPVTMLIDSEKVF